MYEGEVTELTPTESENPLSGYGKTVSHVIVGLKTVRGTKQLRLDPSIYEAILKEKIQVGDVIYVEANTGAVKVRSFIAKCSTLCLLHGFSASVGPTRTHHHMISSLKRTFPYQKAMSTNAKNSSKTSHWGTSMPPMRGHKEARTL